jgi:cell division protein FtsB
MVEKIKNNRFYKALADSRNLTIYIIAIVALSVTWSSIKIIDKNYQLEKRINSLQQDVDTLEQQTKNQKLKNQYFNTDAYLELAARKYFSKAAPGENLLLVPTDVAEKYIHPQEKTAEDIKKSQAKPFYIKHLQEWINFFTHRLQSTD